MNKSKSQAYATKGIIFTDAMLRERSQEQKYHYLISFLSKTGKITLWG